MKTIISSKFSSYIYSLDVFEDFISPTTAAQTLLFTACSKRKEVSYQITFALLVLILSNIFPFSMLNHVLFLSVCSSKTIG